MGWELGGACTARGWGGYCIRGGLARGLARVLIADCCHARLARGLGGWRGKLARGLGGWRGKWAPEPNGAAAWTALKRASTLPR